MKTIFVDWMKSIATKSLSGDERSAGHEVGGGRRHHESKNPYLSARRTWNDLHAASAANRQMWQLIGVLAMLISLAGVGGVVYIGSQSKFIPYVIQVDKLGQALAVAPAQRASVADPVVVRASVAEWLGDVRMVTPDVALQRKAVFHVYAMLATNDPATAKTNEWLNGSDTSSPFKRAAKETVSVDIETVLAQTADTWQVEWIETTRDRQGVMKGQPQHWRALITVYTVPATPDTNEQQMRDNPLGIHVRDFSWSKQL